MAEIALDQTTGFVAAAGQPQRAGGTGLAYDGRVGPLFRLWFKVTLLAVLTLGFYRFWGRTRIRKYLWSRVSLDGERFEYDGTGGELFRRFLLTLVVLAPLLFAPQIARLAGASPGQTGIVQAAQVLLLLFLAYLGYYAGRRYRLNRTLWSGIRGGLDGHSGRYALYGMMTGIATVLTLGLYSPWERVILWRYEARHTCFGDRHFAFDGRGRHLFGAVLLSGVLFIVGLLVAVLLAAALGYGLWEAVGKALFPAVNQDIHEIAALVHNGDWETVLKKYAHLLIAFVMGYFVLIFFLSFMVQAVFAVAFSRFQARWFNYVADHTSFEALRLSAQVTPWPMFKLLLGNMVLQVLTLGLARPFVAHRMLRFTCGNLAVHGIDSLAVLRQSSQRGRPPAEGLAQLLDSGGFA
jgi:uncharacterized membrane protein YjgN (DUF898 family)